MPSHSNSRPATSSSSKARGGPGPRSEPEASEVWNEARGGPPTPGALDRCPEGGRSEPGASEVWNKARGGPPTPGALDRCPEGGRSEPEASEVRDELRGRGTELAVRRLGRVAYAEALALQEELRRARGEARIPDTVLLLEHPDVITFGRSAKPGTALLDDAALRSAGYEVFRVNRGGDVTWHGPGQLVGYPIVDLDGRGRDVHRYLRDLESALIDALADLGIRSLRRDGFAGVWLDEIRKIASIGVGVRHWLTIHGFALNVCCDLDRFSAIVPCGLPGVRMVSATSVLGRPVSLDEAADRVEARLRDRFG